MTIIVVLTALAFGALWLTYLYVAQESLIYYPSGYSDSRIADAERRSRVLECETGEGRQVAFYVPPEKGDSPERVWILFGGNGARALDWLNLVVERQLGAGTDGFLLIDYPGYGRCEGRPAPESIEASVAAILDECAVECGLSRQQLGERVSLVGHSLGAAVALMTAQNEGVGQRVVLLSPFTSMREMAATVVGGPVSHMVRHRYDNRGRMESLLRRDSVQVVIIHGEEDEVIPVIMGKELAGFDPARIKFPRRTSRGAQRYHRCCVCRYFARR